MCLGIPGTVTGFLEESEHLAAVDVAGVTHKVSIALVEEDGIDVGDWVLIHMGFAMELIDEGEAMAAYRRLEGAGEGHGDGLAGVDDSDSE